MALLAGAVALAAGLVYLNALGNPFVYDDFPTVVENPSIRTPGNFLFVLVYSLFRPVVNLSYALDHALWGLEPFGYHLTGVLLHAANAVLLLLLGLAMFRDLGARQPQRPAPSPIAALLPAALFALHPVATEAVGYVSGRAELLCAFFGFSALLTLRRAARLQSAPVAMAALLLLGLGMASKEVAAAVPLIALAYDRLILPGEPSERRRRLRRFHLPLLALLCLGGLARVSVYLFAETTPVVPFGKSLLVQATVFWRYLALLAVPVGQSLVHPFREVSGVFEPRVLLSLAGLAAGAVAGWRLRRRFPVAVFAGAWFVLGLLPSSLVPLLEAMAERRLYLASAGPFLAAGVLFGRGLERFASHRAICWTGAILALGALGLLTVARNRVWADPVSLWKDAAAKAPQTFAPHYALGNAYRARGDCESALVPYRRAVELLPSNTDGQVNLGICLAQTRRYPEAGGALERARSLAPGDAKIRFNLGTLAMVTGDRAGARRRFTEALALDPSYERARAMIEQLGTEASVPPPGAATR